MFIIELVTQGQSDVYFFFPLLEEFSPLFKHIAQFGPTGPGFPDVVYFAHFQVQARKRGDFERGILC